MDLERFELTDDEVSDFDVDGFLVFENFLDEEETDLLRNIARADRERQLGAASRADGEGGAVKLHVENELRDDIYSAIVRSERLALPMEQLLGDEVYHYHHKIVFKEARVGGAWAWHQDYGYWYNNGCLFPHMASCMIAVDKATRENGCLQVIRGSHEIGRVDHGPVGEQTGADPERVEAALERLELVHVELEPGSAVMFHGNLLHRSDQNKSDHARWAFICCYNTQGNDPFKESRHPRYTPLNIGPNSAIREVGQRQWAELSGGAVES